MIAQQDVGEEYRKVSLNQNYKRRLFTKSNQLQKSLNNSSHLNFLQESLRDVHIIYENQYYLIKRVENVNKCMYFTQIVPSDINNFDISSMNHENILQINQEDNIFIAEPMLMTLQTYIYQQQDISNELEQIIKQIVNFIFFLHSQNLAHTELSTNNFLINEKLQIRAVPLPQEGVQYRAPERIIGYDVDNMKSEDMFQLGCIILELLARKPVLESEDETNQMLKYTLFLGRPQEIIYRNIYHQLPDVSPVDIDKYLSNSDQKLVNLIPQLLVYDPDKRATIQQVQNYLNQIYPAYRPSSKSSISNSPLSLKSQRMTPYSLRNRTKRYGNLNNGSPNYYYQDETPSINLYDDSPNDLSPRSNFSKKRFDEQMRTIAEETSFNNDGVSQLREKILSGKQNHPSIDNNQGAQQYNKSQYPRNQSSASNNQRLQSAQKPQTPSRYKQGSSSVLFDNDDNLKPQIILDRMTPLSNRRSNNNSFSKNNNNTPGKGFFIDVPDKEKNIQDHLTSFQHLQKIFGEENKQKTDDEKKRRLEEDMRRQAEEERKRRDEEEKRKQDEAEKKKKDEEEEKKRRDEAEKKKRDDEEKKKIQEEEEKRKLDEEEKEKIKRDLDDKKKKEEDEKRIKEEEEKRKKDDLQKKKDEEQKQILDDLKDKQKDEEKKKKLEEELRKKLEEEQKKKELELKRQMEEEQSKREQERQKQFEAEKMKQQQEMKKKIEEEQKRIEEQLRKQFEQQQKQKEEELRKKEEEQRKKDEELKKKEEEKLKLEQELKKKDEALKLKEEEDRKLREELAKKENQQKQEEQAKLLKAQKEAEEKLRKQLEEEQQKLKKLQEELLKKKKEDDEIVKQQQVKDQKAKEEEIRQLKEKQEQLAEQERKQKEIAADLEQKEKLAQEALKNQQLQIQEEARKKEELMLQELKKKEEELKKQKEQAELERKKKEEELEQQRQREQEEIEKKQEMLKQKEQELEKQRKAEEQKQREFEEQKKKELENQKMKEMELNQLKQQELAKLKEIEEKRQRDEQEKQNKQREEEKRLQEIEKQKKKELQDLMKQKELERLKLKELEEKEKELAKKKGEDQKKMAKLAKQKKYQQQQQLQQPKESDDNIRLQKEDSQNESSKKPLKQPKSSSKLILTEQSLDDKKPTQMNNNNNQGNIVILPESTQRQQMISNILQQEIEFNEIYRQRQGYTHFRFKNNQLSTPNSNISVNTRYSQPSQQNSNGSKVSPQMYDSKQSFYPQNNHDNSEANPSLNFRTPRINTDHSTIKSALINTNDRNNQNPNLKMESTASNIPRIKQKIQLNGNTIVVEETPENSIYSIGNQPSYQPVYKEQQPRIINKNKPIIPPLRSIATSLPPTTVRRKQSPPSIGTDRKSKENKKYNTLNKSVDVKKKKKKSKGGKSEIRGNHNNNDDYKMPPLSARNESFQHLQDERTKFRQSHDGQLITQSNTDSIPSILNPARLSQQHIYLQTKPDQPTVFNTRLLARPPTFLIQKDTDED